MSTQTVTSEQLMLTYENARMRRRDAAEQLAIAVVHGLDQIDAYKHRYVAATSDAEDAYTVWEDSTQ